MSKPLTELVIASHNQGKVKEISALLAPYGVQVFNGGEMVPEEPVEDAPDFMGNALIKAEFFAERTGKPALADDSGLVVPALGGAPGIYSARWAEVAEGQAHTEQAGTSRRDFPMAMEKIRTSLLDATGKEQGQAAYFACALAVMLPGGAPPVAVEGRVNGVLSFPPRGTRGFGYDPIFIADGMHQTFAEINPEEKHGISHRADAFKKLVKALRAQDLLAEVPPSG